MTQRKPGRFAPVAKDSPSRWETAAGARSEEIARDLRRVTLSGNASTVADPGRLDDRGERIARAETRTTRKTLARIPDVPDVGAVARDLVGVTMSGHASTIGGPSLAEQYLRWKRSQEIASAKNASVEDEAMRRSRRRIAKRVRQGRPPVRALADGFGKYRRLGGRLPLDEWARRAG